MVERRRSVEEIIDQRYDDLLHFVRYRIRDPDEVRDLVQEAFMRLLRRDREHLIERPEAYLFRIAANLAYEHRLRSGRFVSDMQCADLDDHSEAPEARAAEQERMQRLDAAFARLPPLPKAALLLQRRDGLSYAEIAARLGTTKHMVKKHLSRAMLECRAAMIEEHR